MGLCTGHGALPSASTPSHFKPNRLRTIFSTDVSLDELECEQCPYPIEDVDSLVWYKRWRFAIHMTIEKIEYSPLATAVSWGLLVSILVSTVGFVLETEPDLAHLKVWYIMEVVVSIIFSVEYVLRLTCCKHPGKFVFTFLNVIDLLSILPFYIEVIGIVENAGDETGLRVIRVIRLARIFRLFKNPQLKVFMNVLTVTFYRSSDSFGLVISLLLLVVIVFSGLVYYVEKGTYDPETGKFLNADGTESDFRSILSASWWCMETITTVGYGDIAPVTPAGKVIASLAMLTGIMVLAFPVVIIGTNFDGVYMEFKEAKAALELEKDARLNHRSSLRRINSLHRDELFSAASEVMMNVHSRHSTGRQILESVDALHKLTHLLIEDVEDEEGDTGCKECSKSKDGNDKGNGSGGATTSATPGTSPADEVDPEPSPRPRSPPPMTMKRYGRRQSKVDLVIPRPIQRSNSGSISQQRRRSISLKKRQLSTQLRSSGSVSMSLPTIEDITDGTSEPNSGDPTPQNESTPTQTQTLRSNNAAVPPPPAFTDIRPPKTPKATSKFLGKRKSQTPVPIAPAREENQATVPNCSTTDTLSVAKAPLRPKSNPGKQNEMTKEEREKRHKSDPLPAPIKLPMKHRGRSSEKKYAIAKPKKEKSLVELIVEERLGRVHRSTMSQRFQRGRYSAVE